MSDDNRLKCRGSFANLPMWARDHIDVLEMRLGEMRARIDGTAVEGGLVQIHGADPSPGVDHHPVAQRNVWLEVLPNQRIQFRVEEVSEWTPAHVVVHGDYPLVVSPTASNAFDIFPYETRQGVLAEWPGRKR